jgi:hypothetical protein
MLEARSAAKLEETVNLIHHYDVIGIDEGQFFEDIVTFAETCANLGKVVIVSALDGYRLRLRYLCFLPYVHYPYACTQNLPEKAIRKRFGPRPPERNRYEVASCVHALPEGRILYQASRNGNRAGGTFVSLQSFSTSLIFSGDRWSR